ncbi:MAG: hypothetical protein CVV33_05680 [Methanomicrobiales archaeon HGW-Methanomicrobiales-4]|nr:MAG: hypothetical protein CVV33_05680 [Methanomicrobiales archaeon HGW-Methanomicrobiales-4]
MTIERKIASLFRLDDDTWNRHANPWSVISRNTTLPLLIIAFWSRVWFGWLALISVFLALAWTWLNPRLFSEPDSFDHWSSKAVFGERLWLNRDQVPIPLHHRRVPNILSVVSGIGMLLVIWGVIFFEIWPTLLGATVIYLSKLWFLDRMVWLWEDMNADIDNY